MKTNRRKQSAVVTILAGLAAVFLGGCAPVVLPPSQHAPSSPEQVKLYQKQPAKYESLATIMMPITPEMQWNDKMESVVGIDALKSRAAALGANGVLMTAQPGTFDVMATTGYHGSWYQVPVKDNPKRAVVQAIFVVSE